MALRPAWPPQVHSPSFSCPYPNHTRSFASLAFAFTVSWAFRKSFDERIVYEGEDEGEGEDKCEDEVEGEDEGEDEVEGQGEVEVELMFA